MPSFIVFLEMPSLIFAFALQEEICWQWKVSQLHGFSAFELQGSVGNATYLKIVSARPPISAEFLYVRVSLCIMHRRFVLE